MNRLRYLDAMHVGDRLKALVLTAVLVSIPLTNPQSTYAATPLTLAPAQNQFTVGWNSACAIDTKHHLYCWGDNSGGTLGLKASVKFSQTPRRVGTGKWRSIYGDITVCGIKWDYSVWCWGHPGRIGITANNPYASVRFTPQLVTRRASLSVERIHPNIGICIRDRGKKLWCQLDVDDFFRGGWQLINSTPVVTASYVGSSICFITVNGTMKCWGKNLDGTFPTGAGTPVLVKKPRTASGSYQSLLGYPLRCALDSDGYQRCWGGGWRSPSGLPQRLPYAWAQDNGVPCIDAYCVITPSVIEKIQWKTLWADQCGVLLDDAVLCIDEVQYVSSSTAAFTVTVSDSFTDIKLGASVGCGIKEDLSLWCWGLNDFRTDSVSGPRTFGRDSSDYTESPVQILTGP
jgi:hypothetical protein